MAKILKGADVVAAMNEQLSAQVAALQARGVTPTLAIMRVGEREDDISYEKGAMKRCAKVGVAVKNIILPANISERELLIQVGQADRDPAIHGCLLFRPLPKHIDEAAVCATLNSRLDIDGVTDGSLMGVFANTDRGYPPCTAQAVIEILDHFGYALQGKRVAVIGRSLVVGKPLAMMLLNRHATVTICHTRTGDLPARAQEADILIAAAGQAEMVDERFVREGQIVIDVGINFNEAGKLVGDVRFDRVEPIVAALTPTPGGVGSVTTSVLVKHVVAAAGKACAV